MKREENLKKYLLDIQDQQFTGVLNIKVVNGKQWRLYFCLSNLIWIDGSYHPYRGLKGLLKKYCPDLDQNKINFQDSQKWECWNYHIIISLLQNSLVKKEDLINLIEFYIFEILFDISQAENWHILKYELVSISRSFLLELGLKISLVLLSMETVIAKSEKNWLKWEQKGLANVSPNLAPCLKNKSLLKKQFSYKNYTILCSLLNGKLTLRELAIKLEKDVFKVTLWLKSYMEKGFIELVEVKDIPIKYTLISLDNNNEEEIKEKTRSKLIFCIDDSLQICQIMEYIINNAGYEFMAIQDPLKALTKIIKYKPDLIFLDLMMPIINGYEMCAQIRRISQLQDIPILILTSNDGVIDRVRAKFVGASAFLGKPINEKKVIRKINYFLSPKSIELKQDKSLNQLKINPQTIV